MCLNNSDKETSSSSDISNQCQRSGTNRPPRVVLEQFWGNLWRRSSRAPPSAPRVPPESFWQLVTGPHVHRESVCVCEPVVLWTVTPQLVLC